jgi:hypothetical protein
LYRILAQHKEADSVTRFSLKKAGCTFCHLRLLSREGILIECSQLETPFVAKEIPQSVTGHVRVGD